MSCDDDSHIWNVTFVFTVEVHALSAEAAMDYAGDVCQNGGYDEVARYADVMSAIRTYPDEPDVLPA